MQGVDEQGGEGKFEEKMVMEKQKRGSISIKLFNRNKNAMIYSNRKYNIRMISGNLDDILHPMKSNLFPFPEMTV